jgi:DNA-binding NarL/FixJ family response regulator
MEQEAIQQALDRDPDVVVMDFKMPEADGGVEAARQIREQRPDQQVMCSAFVDSEVEARAREVGVTVCIPKLSGVEALAREISALAMDLAPTGS